jgi:hypothetical protein
VKSRNDAGCFSDNVTQATFTMMLSDNKNRYNITPGQLLRAEPKLTLPRATRSDQHSELRNN